MGKYARERGTREIGGRGRTRIKRKVER